ncbi:hypothetical protein J5226_20700 [Lysobacter sp. K5869]|uniref:hypothetical protein n=1 Tax=Lysobacter sp. K5869 TaxID=2820808 RepID=UPI001C06323A|nr:hypothetical protein [Lysobacter sp. K5869]QWP75996.1 hypothetical protein J5226_20700 [Lysobacter sp. K5869]
MEFRSPAPRSSAPQPRKTGSRRLPLLAVGLFGFAAALTASAQVEECERCRLQLESCLLSAESPMATQGCYNQHQRCTSKLDCPAPEALRQP